MNSGSIKFYHLNKLIGLDFLNLSFVHFKKLMKVQFLKYGNTWFPSHLSELRARLNFFTFGLFTWDGE